MGREVERTDMCAKLQARFGTPRIAAFRSTYSTKQAKAMTNSAATLNARATLLAKELVRERRSRVEVNTRHAGATRYLLSQFRRITKGLRGAGPIQPTPPTARACRPRGSQRPSGSRRGSAHDYINDRPRHQAVAPGCPDALSSAALSPTADPGPRRERRRRPSAGRPHHHH